MTSNVIATIESRTKTHGEYHNVSKFYTHLMQVLHDEDKATLTNEQYMALSMIFSKIARVLAGNANFIDHWHDIQGYAKLVEIKLEKGKL